MGKRKLPEQKKQDGTWRDDRHLPDAVQVDPVQRLPMPPATLHRDAHQYWNVQASALLEMKVLSSADLILLEAFCNEKLKYDRAGKLLEDEDMVDETNAGTTKMVNLHLRIQDQALTNMLNISKKFGFSPLDRMDIGAAKSDKADPLKKYIKE